MINHYMYGAMLIESSDTCGLMVYITSPPIRI